MSDIDTCSRPRFAKDDSCHRKQCSKCTEYYIGFPEKSHQCYRQMSVEQEYCLDPDTQSECYTRPQMLNNGQAVFFVVLPKFMNVDIRIVIDVTLGKYYRPRVVLFQDTILQVILLSVIIGSALYCKIYFLIPILGRCALYCSARYISARTVGGIPYAR